MSIGGIGSGTSLAVFHDHRHRLREAEFGGQGTNGLLELVPAQRQCRSDDKMPKGIDASEAPRIVNGVGEVRDVALDHRYRLVVTPIEQMPCERTHTRCGANADGLDHHQPRPSSE